MPTENPLEPTNRRRTLEQSLSATTALLRTPLRNVDLDTAHLDSAHSANGFPANGSTHAGEPNQDEPNQDGPDLMDQLLNVAWFNQYQLGVLISLVGSMQSSAQTVGEVIDGAQQFGVADKSSIGAAATLLSLVREGDEVAVAECMSRAMACFDDDELIAGSAALTASLTEMVADVLNIDVLAVQGEMIDAVIGDHPTASTPTDDTPLHRMQRVRHAGRRRTGRLVCATARATDSLKIS